MNLLMNGRNLSRSWRDVFGAHAPATGRCPTSSSATTDGVACHRFWTEWFSQRTWEDDGGCVRQDMARLTG